MLLLLGEKSGIYFTYLFLSSQIINYYRIAFIIEYDYHLILNTIDNSDKL